MSGLLRITFYEDHRLVHSEEYSEPVELGRQDKEDGEVYSGNVKAGRWRIPIARKDETTVSKKQALVEMLSRGLVRLTNQSGSVPIRLLEDESELKPGGSREVPLPATLRLGSREVHIESVHLESLAEAPLPPGSGKPDHSLLNTIIANRTPEGESLIPWLQATMDVLHGAATSLDCFDRAAGALVDMIGMDAGRVLLLEGGEWRVKALREMAGRAAPKTAETPWRPSTRVLKRLQEEKRTFFWQVLPTGEETLAGVQALVAAPILDREGQVIGALYGHCSESGPAGPFGRSRISRISRLQAMLVQLLASAVAAGLAQKRLVQMERDLEIGRQIQAGFLPETLPQVPGWEVAALFRPAREVSGDFYDAFALSGGQLALIIADVCDKGVGAALYMTLVRSLLRAFAEQAVGRELIGSVSAPGLAERIVVSAVELTNNYVAQTHGRACMFASVFFGVLDTASGRLTYINAGHDAPAVLGAAEVKARLTTTGKVVGVEPNLSYAINTVQLEPGDTLFAYTDGVTEARDSAGQFFTEQRLLSLLEKPALSANALVGEVFTNLHEHSSGTELYDDVTMLAVRRLP